MSLNQVKEIANRFNLRTVDHELYFSVDSGNNTLIYNKDYNSVEVHGLYDCFYFGMLADGEHVLKQAYQHLFDIAT